MILSYIFYTNLQPVYRNDWDVEEIGDAITFQYEVPYEDALAYYNNLSEVEFVDAAKHAFEQLDDESKAFFLNPENGYAIPELMNGKEFNWNAVYRDMDLKEDFISEILLDDYEYLEDELKSYFEDDAEKEFYEQVKNDSEYD